SSSQVSGIGSTAAISPSTWGGSDWLAAWTGAGVARASMATVRQATAAGQTCARMGVLLEPARRDPSAPLGPTGQSVAPPPAAVKPGGSIRPAVVKARPRRVGPVQDA